MIALVVAMLLHVDGGVAVVSRSVAERVTFTADEALAISLTVSAVRAELARDRNSRSLSAYYVAVERVGVAWRVTWHVNDARVRDGAIRFKVDVSTGSIERESDESGLLRKR